MACTGGIRESDDRCGFCHSLNPETLLRRMREGTVKIQGTTKCYKIYVLNNGGEPFKQTYGTTKKCTCSDCGREHDAFAGFVTSDTNSTKFYMEHFTEAQFAEFKELHARLLG